MRNGAAATLRGEILDLRHWERAMAAQFNASRGAVREASLQLKQLGIIAGWVSGAPNRSLCSAIISVLGLLMALGVFPDPVLVWQLVPLSCP